MSIGWRSQVRSNLPRLREHRTRETQVMGDPPHLSTTYAREHRWRVSSHILSCSGHDAPGPCSHHSCHVGDPTHSPASVSLGNHLAARAELDKSQL
ncbi:hypothetical protein E2C01_026130 [Portunus trituberculatus]|uniref:Uncharacterized protein n=1 Tax=Portunus trituberculatus TaxID=210409 RepID=A0A5B7EEX7_PORTR|nr:hypothetical protein [Portunus trituberculatus]